MMNIHQFLAVVKFSRLFPLRPHIILDFLEVLKVFDNWVHSFTIRILKYMVHSMLIKYFSVTCYYYDCKNYKQFVCQQLLPLLWLKKMIMTWTVMENILNVEWQSNSTKYFCLKFRHALQKNPFINVPSKYLYGYMYSKHFIINMIQFLEFYYWADIVVLHNSYKTFCISHVR